MKKYNFSFFIIASLMAALTFVLKTGYLPFNAIKGYSSLNKAKILLEEKQTDLAIPLLQQAKLTAPNDYEAYYLLGLIETDLNVKIKYLSEAADKNPNKVEILIFLAYAQVEKRNYSAAEKLISSAKTIAPTDSLVYGSISDLYNKMGNMSGYFDSLYQYSLLISDESARMQIFAHLNSIIKEHPKEIILESSKLSGTARQNSIVLDKNNILHALTFEKKHPDLLMYVTSKDYGATWTINRVLYTGNHTEGILLLTPDNITHFFFGNAGKSIYYENSSTYTPIILDNSGSNIQAEQYKNTIFTTWETDNKNFGKDILLTTIRNNSISHPKKIASNSINPSLLISQEGTIYLIYNTDTIYPSNQGKIYFMQKKLNSEWDNALVLSGASEWAGGGNGIISEDGTLHLIYLSSNKKNQLDLVYRKYKDGNWSQQTQLNQLNSFPYLAHPPVFITGRVSPDICTSRNNVYIFWRGDENDSTSPIYLTKISKPNNESNILLGYITKKDFSYFPICLTDLKENLYFLLTNELNEKIIPIK